MKRYVYGIFESGGPGKSTAHRRHRFRRLAASRRRITDPHLCRRYEERRLTGAELPVNDGGSCANILIDVSGAACQTWSWHRTVDPEAVTEQRKAQVNRQVWALAWDWQQGNVPAGVPSRTHSCPGSY
jgi:hypothetical protein